MTPQKGLFLTLAATGLMMTSAALAQQTETRTYRAELMPLNAEIAGSEVSGEAVFTISGDQMMIHISANGVPPGMEHLQHFHGFAMGDQKAECPTASADANGDGVVDLIETEALAGTTMVPFHDAPASLEIVRDTYPTADENGSYIYDQTVPLKTLQDAFAEQFSGQDLDLDRRVVFLHGVPASTQLPETAASLDDIPAQVTLPIACGEIRAENNG